jgi:hypothetical protein
MTKRRSSRTKSKNRRHSGGARYNDTDFVPNYQDNFALQNRPTESVAFLDIDEEDLQGVPDSIPLDFQSISDNINNPVLFQQIALFPKGDVKSNNCVIKLWYISEFVKTNNVITNKWKKFILTHPLYVKFFNEIEAETRELKMESDKLRQYWTQLDEEDQLQQTKKLEEHQKAIDSEVYEILLQIQQDQQDQLTMMLQQREQSIDDQIEAYIRETNPSYGSLF